MPSGIRRRKLNRSSVSKTTRRVKSRQKKLIIDNSIIRENWDPKLTLKQNYKKLGLATSLEKAAGGEEKDIGTSQKQEQSLAAKMPTSKSKSKPKSDLDANEAKIIRNADGTVKIEYGKAKSIDSDDDDDAHKEDDEWNGFEEGETKVVKQLKELAKNEVKKPRSQSEREQEWVQRLIEKHGDDYEAMFWDKKLNIYQQSVGDLKKRIKKWKKDHQQ